MRVNALPINDSFKYDYQGKMNPFHDAGNVQPTGLDSKDSEKCQTCAERKYVDGSNEMNVSFKAPGHISPEASKAMVSAHEQEHVSNARAEGSKANKELVSSSVRIKMARCPECGVSYAAGGETTTVMRTTIPRYNGNNPYSQRQKAIDADRLAGRNFNTEQ